MGIHGNKFFIKIEDDNENDELFPIKNSKSLPNCCLNNDFIFDSHNLINNITIVNTATSLKKDNKNEKRDFNKKILLGDCNVCKIF